MPHVVTGNLKARAEAPHQAGVHGPEAPEVHSFRQSEFFGDRLHVPVEQIVPVKRLANPIGKNEVVRFAELLVTGPHSLHRSEHDAMLIERHLTLACVRFHIVELIIVDTFVHDDAVAKDVLPSKSKSLTRPHGGEDNQYNH